MKNKYSIFTTSFLCLGILAPLSVSAQQATENGEFIKKFNQNVEAQLEETEKFLKKSGVRTSDVQKESKPFSVQVPPDGVIDDRLVWIGCDKPLNGTNKCISRILDSKIPLREEYRSLLGGDYYMATARLKSARDACAKLGGRMATSEEIEELCLYHYPELAQRNIVKNIPYSCSRSYWFYNNEKDAGYVSCDYAVGLMRTFKASVARVWTSAVLEKDLMKLSTFCIFER